LKEFEIKLDPFEFGSVQFQFELRHPALCHPGPLFRSATKPLFISAGHHPVPVSPRSPLVHARAIGAERHLPEPTFPVALSSTGPPSSVGIWPVPPLSSLSLVSHPLSLSSPNPRPSLTSLSPSDMHGASLIVGDHRRPPLSSEHH
jgi:hypothetical protein